MNRFDSLETKDFLGFNAKLQQKKNALRSALHNKGKLQKDKKNSFDNYTYFSEAGYKALFTELFAEHKLELTPTLLSTEDIEGTEKMPFGRRVTVEFNLADIETGFYETSSFIGESFDKGDKAIYKAYTGALKYYFASAFNVATGDDPENDSPEGNRNGDKKSLQKPKPPTKEELASLEAEMKLKGIVMEQILKTYHVDSRDKLTKDHLTAAFKTLAKMPIKEQEVDINSL